MLIYKFENDDYNVDMDIKEQLKSIDVKISKLAGGLEISRPTLDSYIDLYERGEKIPNEKYQKIFDYLFSTENTSAVEFAQKYDYVKRVMLAEVKHGIEDQTKARRRTFLSQSIVTCVNDIETNLELLEFIFLLMRSSSKPAIKLLTEYICLSNGITDWEGREMTDEEKAYFSSLSAFFDAYKQGRLKIDEERVKMLLERNAEMNGHRAKDPQDEEIAKFLRDHGMDPSTIDLEYLKKMLSKK